VRGYRGAWFCCGDGVGCGGAGCCGGGGGGSGSSGGGGWTGVFMAVEKIMRLFPVR